MITFAALFLHQKITTTMKDFGKREEHKSCDTTVVVNFTHENRFGDLIRSDQGKVSVDHFTRTLNRDECQA